MVTQVSTFDPFRIRKFGVGFDSMVDQLTSDFFTDSFQGTQNFPPYNIIKTDDLSYDIEMAVAGFSEEDLEIDYADNVLTVSSKETETFKDSKEPEYIHMGLAFFSLRERINSDGSDILPTNLITLSSTTFFL